MNSRIHSAIWFILIACVATMLPAQPVPALGDYGSVASGVWATVTTWKIYSSNNAFDSAATLAPAVTNNVWIMNGDTVTTGASGMTCKNLFIIGNSVLHNTSGNYQGSPAYLDVRGGNVYVEAGSSFGTGWTEAQGIDMKSGTTTVWTLTGGGSFYVCRFRNNTTSFAIDSIVIDANVNTTYQAAGGGAGASIYTDQGSGKVINAVIVHAGKTLTSGTNSNIGTGSSVNTDVVNAPTFSIYGTMNVGAGAALFFRSSGASPTLHIYPGGSVTAAKNFTPCSVTSLPTNVIVDAGASLTVGTSGIGTADFTRSAQTVTGGGSFTVAPGATINVGAAAGLDATNGPVRTATRTFTDAKVAFVGAAAQVTGSDMPAAVRTVTINNAAGVSLTKDLTVDTLAFSAGNLLLGASTLTMTAGPAVITGSAAGRTVVSDGTGLLAIPIPAVGKFTWPLGTTTDIFPLTLNITYVSGPKTLQMGLRDRAQFPPMGPIAATAKVLGHYFHAVDQGTGDLQVDTLFAQYSAADVIAQGITDETQLRVCRTNTGVWDTTSVASIDTAANLIAFTNVNGPGDFVVTDANGVGPGALLSKKVSAFGQVLVATSATDTIIVTNAGTSTLTVSSVTSSDAHFVVAPASASISAGRTQGFVITFTPDSAKAFSGIVVFVHDGTPSADTVTVSSGVAVLTGVAELPAGTPAVYVLDRNFPNPFNPSTTLQYGLPVRSHVTLTVYSVLGQKVDVLVNEVQEAGFHRAIWNSSHQNGASVASGVYFYRIEANPVDGGKGFSQVNKMLLLK